MLICVGGHVCVAGHVYLCGWACYFVLVDMLVFVGGYVNLCGWACLFVWVGMFICVDAMLVCVAGHCCILCRNWHQEKFLVPVLLLGDKSTKGGEENKEKQQ